MRTALGHLKVLDLTRVLAGPWATQNLADMGAEVVKVERPGAGDDTRGWGPPFLKDEAGDDTADAAYYLSANRGKKSITVDIASVEGQRLIRELARTADVLVENYKVGTLKRYGLGYENLAEINPQLVYCSITGFGQTGPYASLPGYDFVFQGMGGLMSLTGLPDDQPGGGPMKSGLAITDLLTGMYATTAILAALEHRHLSGRGQHIDISLLDCVVGINGYQAMNYFLTGKVPQRLGNGHPNMVPYQVFRCKEGNVIVAIGNDTQFASFCRVIGRPDLAANPLFATVKQRNINRAELLPQIAEIMLAHTMTDWVSRLEAANVPCGPINDMQQVFENAQVQHRQMKLSLPHTVGGEIPGLANPIRFSDTPIRYGRAAPTLGEHTDEVLRERLKLDDDAIAQLKGSGIV